MKAHKTIKRGTLSVGAVSVLLVMSLWYADMDNTSPGAMTTAHAQVPHLAGSKGCQACHGSDSQGMTQSCLSCHQDVADQISERTGLHGIQDRNVASDCAQCHSEHHGRDFQMINDQSFSLAGVADWKHFDHAGLGFKLAGKHQTITCQKCHSLADVEALPVGEKRFLGLNQNCTSCHTDVHKGQFGANCASCHGQEHPFRSVAKFAHTAAFPLAGAHAKAGCVDCHKKETVHAVEILSSKTFNQQQSHSAVRSCSDCHSSPHNNRFLTAVSRELNVTAGQSCAHCHDASHRTFRWPMATIEPRLHALTGFSLGTPHEKVSCKKCHSHKEFDASNDVLARFSHRYPGRSPDNCRACHADPHLGQFAQGIFSKSDCLDCHHRHSFRPALFTLAHHERTNFPLTGPHAKVACRQCHRRIVEGRDSTGKTVMARVFRGTPTTCKACHGDPHLGQFAKGHFSGSDCLDCHNSHSFSPARFTLAHHDRTNFPLTGPHKKVQCNQCHRRTVESRDSTGKTVVTRVFQGTPTSCSACHVDPHRGQFEQSHFRGNDCLKCHERNSFHPPTFTLTDHKKTRFPLTGAHNAVSCNQCHRIPQVDPRRKIAGVSAARVFHGTPTDCKSCHVDVHGGAFDKRGLPVNTNGRTGCARCHTTESFSKVIPGTFDHKKFTGYKLNGPHARARCAACHKKSRKPDSFGRTFGKAAGRNCQDCHKDPHVGQFGATAQVNCTHCHKLSNSFRDLVFDHQTHSRFKLDKVHARLECSKCHLPHALRGGGKAIRYKPLGTRCGDCHVPQGRAVIRTKKRQSLARGKFEKQQR